MQIERLALALRPRNNWEAIDLGVRMAICWCKPLYAAWLAITLPAALLIIGGLAFGLNSNFWAAFLFWWIKPVFDRVALYVLSHAVFGDQPTVRATFRALPELLRKTRLLHALTIGRFSLRRSLTLPIDQLEALTGFAASQRRRLITSRAGGSAFGQLLCWIFMVFCLWMGTLGLVAIFAPESIIDGSSTVGMMFELLQKAFTETDAFYWKWFLLLWVVCDLFMEPLYIAGGFALYLKRRTDLEAWDVEVQFRQIAREGTLEHIVSNAVRVVMPLLYAIGLLVSIIGTPSALATPTREQATENASTAMAEVMKRPEFGEEKTRKELYPIKKEDQVEKEGPAKNKEKPKENRRNESGPSIFEMLGNGLGDVIKVIVIAILAVLVLAIVYVVIRNFGSWRSAKVYTPPAEIAGLDIRPESLPDDVATTALKLAHKGEPRAALSLLFRAALSVLAHRDHVPFSRGDTEEDCVMRVMHSRRAHALAYFRELTNAWQDLAYAHRIIELALIEKLCLTWRQYFADNASPGTSPSVPSDATTGAAQS